MKTPVRIGKLAAEALRFEARLTPKPGLVDAVSNGAHPDMDLALMLRSADALEPTFVACAEAGSAGRPESLQGLGIAGERDMLAATGGVNTHKGALFSLGLLAYAAGKECAAGDLESWVPLGRAEAGDAEWTPRRTAESPYPHTEQVDAIDRLCARAADLSAPWRDAWMLDLVGREPRTHGERAYVELGLLGARGEAASGFATVRRHGLCPLWRALDAGREDAWLVVLAALFAANPDTNLIARGGLPALESVQAWGSGHVDDDPATLRAALIRADADWSAQRWSPGGSADLLAVTWFLDAVTLP